MKSPKAAPRTSKNTDKKAAKAPAKAPAKASKPAAKSNAKSTAKPAPKAAKKSAAKSAKSSAKPAATQRHEAEKPKRASLKKTVGSAVKKTVKAVTSRVSKAVAKIKKKVATSSAVKRGTEAAEKRAKPRTGKSAPAKTPTPKKTPVKTSVQTPVKTAKVSKVPVKPVSKATARSPASSKRPKAFAPRDVARGFGFPAEAPELPEFYGEDRLVLMAKDPEYLFAYWEITPERQAQGRKAMLPGEEYREALRLNWNARDLFDANYLLLPVTHAARKWYMRVPFSGIAYHVEIGWLGSQGHFISLLMSNASDAPESWVATRRRLKGIAADTVLARTLKAGRPQGSSENVPVHVEKLAVPVPGDWNFGAPGSTGSSAAGKKAAAKNLRAG